MGGLSPEAWTWWWACVPIVVVGAPAGAWLVRYARREVIVALLLASIVVQYVAAIVILPMSPARWGLSLGCFVVAALLFGVIARRATTPGERGGR
jgi:hypothetical protein